MYLNGSRASEINAAYENYLWGQATTTEDARLRRIQKAVGHAVRKNVNRYGMILDPTELDDKTIEKIARLMGKYRIILANIRHRALAA